MGKLTVKTGSTSRLEHVFILDSTSTTGAGKTGLTNASVTMSFFRPADTTVTLVTLSAGTLGTWVTGGFKEINATDMPGVYEIGMPNAVFAATFNHSVVMVKGTGIAPVVLEYNLVSYDPLDTVRLGLTALPNVASGVAGAIITSGIGTAQLTTATGQVTVASGGITTGSFTAGAIDAAAIATNAIGSDELAATATEKIADAILARKLNSTGNETSSSTIDERTVRHALRYLRNKISISGSTMTVTLEDDITTAWTATLTTSPGVDPVTTIDPA